MRRRVVRCLWIACCCLVCGLGAAAQTISIPGSGNSEFVLSELAKAFNQQQSQYRVEIPPSIGTAGALRAIAQGTATVGRVGRVLSESERNGLTYKAFGRDPVAFVAGVKVSLRNITGAQVVDIYRGHLKNWSELGGQPGTIRAVGRELTDASRLSIGLHIKTFADMKFHDDVKVVLLDPQMIELLDRYPTSLGFLNRSALSAARTRLTILDLDGVAPTAQNVVSGRYPYFVEFAFVYREGDLPPAGKAFLKFVDSAQGEHWLRASGVVPLHESP